MIRTNLVLALLLISGGAFTVHAQARPTPTPTPARPVTPQTTAADVPVPPSRIALVDTEQFADEKKGIVRYVDAVKQVQAQFAAQNQELINLQNRINGLVEELRRLRTAANPDQRAIQTKQEEGTRLQQDWTTKKQRFDEDYSKRYRELTAPISEQIGKALDQYARERGITMTLDLSKLMPAMLTALPAVDITDAFVADFNRKNPRTGAPVTRP